MEGQDTRDSDSAAAARRARFGRLPERIHHEDLVEEKPATPKDPVRYAYDPDGSWRFFSCLAVDLGL